MTASQLLLFLYDVVSQEPSLMVLLDVSMSLNQLMSEQNQTNSRHSQV